jgi:membrane-associated phospholipid phosphatase
VLVGATWRAFHAVWFQKWFVHRRLRPEEFGGRVHLRRLFDEGDPAGQPFPVNPLLFASSLFDPSSDYTIFDYNARQNANRRTPPLDRLCRPSFDGTYLLPQAYAEGSPLHPSYGSGHSTVSGCLATLLKAFFHNDWRFPNPVEPNEDGTSVRLYTGPDADDLTVAGELDKLASNIGIGRLWAGVHWRSDHEEALLLGEQLAISILCDQRNTFNEPYEFRFRPFDFGPYGDKVIRIRPDASRWDGPGTACPTCVETLSHDEYDPVLPGGAACERRRRPGPQQNVSQQA